MSEAAEGTKTGTKRGRLPLILGGLLFVAGGGGGLVAVQAGLIPGPGAQESGPDLPALPDVAYLPVPRLTIGLGDGRFLRFEAQLEVGSAHREEVAAVLPRVSDVLNGYLRAVEPADLEDRAALIRLRAQMLRRIQLVTGPGRVRDLLVMEFVVGAGS